MGLGPAASVAQQPDSSADAHGRPVAAHYRLRTVVLDAGHGGKDKGCAGPDGAREAAVALKIVLELGHLIEENMPDVKVVYTRRTDDFVELADRAGVANKANADLFISVHCNAGPSAARGTEVWTMGPHKTEANLAVAKRENAVILQEDNYKERYSGFDPRSPQSHILFSLYQSAHIDNSLRFAAKVDHEFRTSVKRPSRGVKQAGFLVLWKSTMPSALIEVGFLTNPGEEQYLNDKAGQSYMAAGIYRAFRQYKQDLEASSAAD
ncbi:N-acetylmuramoyl-L-alanine amidase [Hymenobacter jeollabukensis]|uniref:N-acetylmuramoyl-L-alanine amidase n=1 Tax=Hymenobacter jeollabukensis TaxID=2025313 RepID=A0A5R8WQI0_9BACT|nr:N-acetylmuramoyl-L-alanine amidase [Hymenobacter jeollabukensis]